jgi:Transposase
LLKLLLDADGRVLMLPLRHLKTGRAYQIPPQCQKLCKHHLTEAGAAFLKRRYFWATHSHLPPVIDAARTIKRHWDGILRWFDSGIANGLIEGINSFVQAAKAKRHEDIAPFEASRQWSTGSPANSISTCQPVVIRPRQTAKNPIDSSYLSERS